MRAFAPMLMIHADDEQVPLDAMRTLRSSTLEWGGGPCPLEVNVAAGAVSRRTTREGAPPLDPRRLGRTGPPYAIRPRPDGCVGPPRRRYSTRQATRPFDRNRRPRGLRIDEGFNLDILSDAQNGRRRIAPDGSLVGLPAYFERRLVTVHRRSELRINYWFLYGRSSVVPDGGDYREGDWKRVEVTVRRTRPGRHRLTAVRFRRGDRWRSVPWRDVGLAGPGSTHPVIYLERGTHSPRIRASCDGCLEWRTWSGLRDVRDEPWYGYRGGWGAIGRTDATSGSAGPSPDSP